MVSTNNEHGQLLHLYRPDGKVAYFAFELRGPRVGGRAQCYSLVDV